MAAKKKKSSSTPKKVDAEGAASSKTETQVPSPQSIAGDIIVEDVSIKEEPKVFPFKNVSYDAKKLTKKRISKGLKQILALERSLPWSEDAVLCKLEKFHKIVRLIKPLTDYFQTRTSKHRLRLNRPKSIQISLEQL